MTGNGGLFAPGRWHSQGQRVVYSSSSLALATLELFVNYVKSRILIPEALVEELGADLVAAFVRDPESFDARGYGDAWLKGGESCVLEVPSRVVPDEANYLINPLHPDFGKITATTEPYVSDPRLLE